MHRCQSLATSSGNYTPFLSFQYALRSLKLALTFHILDLIPQLKYHDLGKARTVRPRVGQWNMINAVSNEFIFPLSEHDGI